jgi:hypothetical protein
MSIILAAWEAKIGRINFNFGVTGGQYSSNTKTRQTDKTKTKTKNSQLRNAQTDNV